MQKIIFHLASSDKMTKKSFCMDGGSVVFHLSTVTFVNSNSSTNIASNSIFRQKYSTLQMRQKSILFSLGFYMVQKESMQSKEIFKFGFKE